MDREESTKTNGRPKRRKLIRVAIAAVAVVFALLLTGCPQEMLVERVMANALGASVEVEWGGFLGDLRIDSLRVYGRPKDKENDAPFLTASDIRVDYRLGGKGGLAISSVVIDELAVYADGSDSEDENFAFVVPLLEPAEEEPPYLPKIVSIGSLCVKADFPDASVSLSDLHVRVEIESSESITITLEGDSLSGSWWLDSPEFEQSVQEAEVDAAIALAGERLESTFSARVPELLEIEGPDSAVFARQGQFRWTQKVMKDLTVAVAIEDPNGDFTVDGVGNSANENSEWPDFMSHIRHDDSWGHLQLGGLVREIQFNDGAGKKGDVVGWGTTLSGRIYTFGQDNIQFQGAYGEGIGRYIQGLIGTGSDAAPNSSGDFKALPAGAAFASYQHWWTDTLRSVVGGEYGVVDNSAGQPGTATKNWQGAAINLVWNILPRLLVGVEFGWGRHEIKDGRDGTARRFQTSTQFNFD